MSERQVPWAEGRRALVFFASDGHWRDARGGAHLPNGEAATHWLWEAGAVMLVGDDDEESGGDSVWDAMLPTARTALLPGQCPRCYEVGAHAEGCMVAANIARGVFPHFAPWVMWTLPDKARIYAIPGVVLMSLNLDYAAHPARSAVVTWNDGWEDGRPVFAIGPEGFTLKPWEET